MIRTVVSDSVSQWISRVSKTSSMEVRRVRVVGDGCTGSALWEEARAAVAEEAVVFLAVSLPTR
jgi:hypothetical protein